MKRKRIDIYTIDIGGGHIAPAQAIKQQFDIRGDKDLDVRVVNLGIELNATFLRFLYKFYWAQALRYPPLINAFYRGADNPFLMKMADRMLGITTLPKFVRYLEREKPDVVVSTYFTFTHYLEMLKRVDQLDATAVVLNPEPFDSHQIWFSPVFDWSMVFSQKSHDEIVEKGIPAQKLKTFHFPIKPSFSPRTQPPPVLRAQLGLQKKPFTVLLFFGAEGVGPVRKSLDALIQAGLSMQVVVVCGRNQKLKDEIDRLAATDTGTVHIEARGYVTNLADFIAAADVVVGKSGPNQVFETLLQCRPLIISSFLANEKETTDWVIHNKLGWLTRSPAHLAALLARLASHPEVLREYQDSIRRMRLRSGAPEIAEFLAGLARQKRPPRKRPMADALRKFRDRVVAEGEALGKRIEATANEGRIQTAAAVRRARSTIRSRAGQGAAARTRRVSTRAVKATPATPATRRAPPRPR
ncbi:MAG TPA: glycosyltransferase [Spirochaetia bacterium]|nr:glycosyltransferase [Spirochaetia bacterium]